MLELQGINNLGYLQFRPSHREYSDLWYTKAWCCDWNTIYSNHW